MSKEWDDLSELEPVLTEEKPDQNNLMIVDGTNLAFRYIKRHNYNSYKEDYIRTITSLGKSYKAKKIICCFDSGASEFRKNMFPEYKAHRAENRTPEEQVIFDEFFKHLNDIISEDFPFDHIRFKGIEADDFMAYCIRKLESFFDNIWVISSDRDIYQLLSEKTHIFNIFSRKEVTIATLLEKYGLTPQEYLMARVIEGDTGDNINGIAGIGPKRSADLIKTHGLLSNLLAKLPLKGKAQYIQNLNKGKDILERNEKLMNLTDYNDEIISGSSHYALIQEIINKCKI